MLNFNAFLGISSGDSGIDIVKFVNRQVGVEFVQLLEFAERLEVINPRSLGLCLDWTLHRCNLFRLATFAE